MGFVARISPEKSLGLFLRAAALVQRRFPGVRFEIVGAGHGLAEMQHFAECIGADVRFLGAEYTAIPQVGCCGCAVCRGLGASHPLLCVLQILESWDIFVNSRLFETFGVANIEAMAMGLPVVSFTSEGPADYMQHGVNGVVLSTPSASAIADAVTYLLTSPRTAEAMGAAGRGLVASHFTISRMVARYALLYSSSTACFAVAGPAARRSCFAGIAQRMGVPVTHGLHADAAGSASQATASVTAAWPAAASVLRVTDAAAVDMDMVAVQVVAPGGVHVAVVVRCTNPAGAAVTAVASMDNDSRASARQVCSGMGDGIVGTYVVSARLIQHTARAVLDAGVAWELQPPLAHTTWGFDVVGSKPVDLGPFVRHLQPLLPREAVTSTVTPGREVVVGLLGPVHCRAGAMLFMRVAHALMTEAAVAGVSFSFAVVGGITEHGGACLEVLVAASRTLGIRLALRQEAVHIAVVTTPPLAVEDVASEDLVRELMDLRSHVVSTALRGTSMVACGHEGMLPLFVCRAWRDAG